MRWQPKELGLIPDLDRLVILNPENGKRVRIWRSQEIDRAASAAMRLAARQRTTKRTR